MTLRTPLYQVALLGDSGVGKTTLFRRLQTGTFLDTANSSTIGKERESFTYHLSVDKTNISVIVFDTAGEERFRSLTRSYHRGKHAVILVFDTEENYTLQDLRGWISEVKSAAAEDAGITWAIIGNKCELERNFEPHLLEVYRLELETNLSFFVSAKTGENVMEAFESVFAYVHRKAKLTSERRAENSARDDSGTISMSSSQTRKNRLIC